MYKKKKYTEIWKFSKENIEYTLYLKGITYYLLCEKKIFDIITINEEKREKKKLKYCYIQFYNLIKKYPNSKYINKIINKQKKIYNKIAKNKYLYCKYLRKRTNIILKNHMLLNIINNYNKSKVLKKTIYTIEKNITNI